MFRTRFFCLLAALLCLAGLTVPVSAAEVDCGEIYCFTAEDFSGEEPISGICITHLPASGDLLLGSRALRPGDILTAGQVAQMTFSSLRSETDSTCEVGYLPIYSGRVADPAVMTLSLRGKENKVPVAEDQALETYKNLPLNGKLKVSDPEEEAMTYTITRQPRRGTVLISGDGSFIYTPKKNKVGVDSFVYTATDESGKTSREATVTVTILKPTDATQYTDTAGLDCRFSAEWMKNSGIFAGETLAGQSCFQPHKEVTRGEFLTMLVKSLEIPTEEELTHTGYTDEIPDWLRPYVAAALRAGLTAGLPEQEILDADGSITGAEAAVLVRNALNLTAAGEVLSAENGETIPVWAESALAAMARQGMVLQPGEPLTRGEAAQLLYQSAKLLEVTEKNRFEQEQ